MNRRAATGDSHIDSLAPDVQRRLAEALESYLDGLEQGHASDPEELVRRYPDLAEPLRDYLGSLDFLHLATNDFRPGEKAPSFAPLGPSAQLGDYTIVREIGRGGMGVVYEARQISLDRRVALKVLPLVAALDPKRIARFHNEAQAAAHLQHQNIVPVFSAGCDGGLYYYVMQYVEGQPLDGAIRQLRSVGEAGGGPASPGNSTAAGFQAETIPLGCRTWARFDSAASLHGGDYFRTAARLGLEAAEALDYAHQCGVIHRDIKPSNLLLDEGGKLWITDFGLARFEANGDLTATGDIMGTIRYMSPEQVAGKSHVVDHRTDVYSLGITLYELATLEEAFGGANHDELFRRILEDEPRMPRQINRAIPVDLETILLKAIAKSPQDRYATAKELAEDLERFLAGEAILARRASLGDRAARWARRHRSLVTAVAGTLLLALAGTIVSSALIVSEHAKTKAALAEAEQNFHQAENNLHRAETHFRQLREVVDRFGAYHAERLKGMAGAEPLRRELLLDALGYYRGFIAYAGKDATLQDDLAVTYSKAAAVTEQLGDKPAALAEYRQATQAFQKAVAAHPGESHYRADMALCCNNLGLLLSTTGKPREAEAAYQQALAIQKQLLAEQPKSDKFQSDLALTYANLGLLAGGAEQPSKAEQAYGEAIRLQEQVARRMPDKADYQHNLAISYNNESFLLAKTDPRKAQTRSDQARSIQEKLAAAHPANMEFQSDLALSYNNLGALQNHNGRPAEAEASYRRAIAIQEQLVRKSPSVLRFRCDLAVSHNNLGRLQSSSNKLDEARQSFHSARLTMQELVDDYPAELSYRSTLAGILNNFGRALEQLGRLDEATKSYEQAIAEQRVAYTKAPQVPQFREFLGKHYANYCRVLRATGQWDKDIQLTPCRVSLCHDQPEQMYVLAIELASAARAIDRNKGGPGQRDSLRDRYARLAVNTLENAVKKGLEHPERIQKDPNLTFVCKRVRSGVLAGPLAPLPK